MPAPPTYSLIATDLDGTLLRDREGVVSARTRSALGRASRAGARHIVVTGRPAPQVRHLLIELEYQGLAVCAQGAQVYDAEAERLLHSVAFDRALAETALGKIEAELGQTFAGVNQDGCEGLMLMEPGFVTPPPALPSVRVGVRDELWAEPITKVLVIHPRMTEDELAHAARTIVGDLVAVVMAGPGAVELQPLGMSKAAGLALAAGRLGASGADTIAFGDMPNDVPMFQWAARGVAMANAHSELKAVADEVTLSNADDGVAVVLERLYA
ncbi:HAD family hydrolase [Streptomyces tsukubensis]|uniref:Haloacid dehalogenase n=1 Tax=Streptomyces tsukubensis TaxID=83656 RepID=A0A1V4A8I4_9ACTN|nr:HAD hydrolase family protein [Streptomyces tsukubensis]OON78495.1 haloacid dehalogenase [Streptomyces tsukubensis]QFR95186.1 HAD hydrolase family protein [Streptomyces tsukubensis]